MSAPIVHIACSPSWGARLCGLLDVHRYRIEPVTSVPGWLTNATIAAPTCALLDSDPGTRRELETGLWDTLRASGAAVIVVCADHDLRFAVRAMREGAVDVVATPVDDAALVGAIGEGAAKAIAMRAHFERGASARRLLAACTRRERAVVSRVARGMLNKQIALELECKESTVKVHRSRAMRKLGLRSPVDVIRLVDTAGGEIPHAS